MLVWRLHCGSGLHSIIAFVSQDFQSSGEEQLTSLSVKTTLLFDYFPNLNTIPHPTVQWRYNGALLDVSNTAKYLVNLRAARLFGSVVTTSDAVSSVHVSGVTQQQFVVAYVVAVSAQGMGAVATEQSYGVTFGNGEWRVWER